MNPYVTCYDIVLDKNRIKVMKILKKKGFHSQRSFFEVESDSYYEVIKDIKPFIEEDDRLAVIRVSRRGKIIRIGKLLDDVGWVL